MSRAWAVRAAVLGAAVAALLLLPAGAAWAHPLGNFTVNRYTGLRLQPDRVLVDYVVDMAEIPAFQARQTIDADGDGTVAAGEASAWRDRECQRLAGRLRAEVGGRRLRFTASGARLAFPPGQGGLTTLRLECDLAAPLPAGGGSRTLRYQDGNADGRIGWREVTAAGDRTTVETADVPARSTSARLTAYPRDLLRSPLDQDRATVSFRPGGAPLREGGGATTGRRSSRPVGVDRATAAFTELVARQRLTLGFALLAVAFAGVLGAAHALAPGHGKTVMAAYLVGLRGSVRQAAAIGGIVTATHTAGVLLLGVVLGASHALAPERAYPVLGLASGLLLAGVGVTLLRRAVRGRHHVHGPGGQVRQLGSGAHAHGDRTGAHLHRVGLDAEPGMSRRGLVALGFAGGLVPSPSAVVVLLGANALGHAWFGVLLVVAYGAGMAATLTGFGLLLLRARRSVDRRVDLRRPGWTAAAGRLLPLATASLIVVAGLVVAVRGAAAL